jgi:hypothetical protein
MGNSTKTFGLICRSFRSYLAFIIVRLRRIETLIFENEYRGCFSTAWKGLGCLGRIAFAASLIAITNPAHGQQYGSEAGRLERTLFDGSVQVGPGKKHMFSFTTHSSFRNARIAGSVQARGGTGNDIRVLVFKGQSAIYDSGQRRSVVLSVDFSDPGQYTLVFDNGFSLVSPKVVSGRISLVHWGVDEAKNTADRQEANDRYEQASLILRRLYDTAKANERVWGTSQLAAAPTIQLINDRSINAAASPADNKMFIFRGLFDFAERAGNRADDVLGAILAHELGHLFYRHPGYGSGTGVKGLFDELRGVTWLDRVQEKEADIFGVRLSCEAGFDPEGVLLVMHRFAEMDSSASSFMKNHPAARERLAYLQAEASQCPSRNATSQATGSATPPDSNVITAQTAPPQEPSMPVATATPAPGAGTWKFTQAPDAKWTIKIDEHYLYGERILPDSRVQVGDFDTVDVKKQGDKYVGTQRMRVTFKLPDSRARGGYRMKTCRWDFGVELTLVSPGRIEGRWEGYGRDSKIDHKDCSRSGQRIWEEATWIRID